MGQVKRKYTIRNPMSDFLGIIFFICHRLLDIQYKFALHWIWPLERAGVKCKYTISKPVSDVLCIGNSNICSIWHRLRDIHS